MLKDMGIVDQKIKILGAQRPEDRMKIFDLMPPETGKV